MFLSLVIPAYNEAGKITQDLKETARFLEGQPFRSEVLIVDDGSRDGTTGVVENFIARGAFRQVTFKVLSYGKNRGKGFAVRYGMVRTEGEYVAFMDAGLCVPLPYLEKGIEVIRRGFDFATASRRLPGTQIVRRQPLYRRIGSQVFWLVVQGFMGIRVTDSQCGFKIYKGDVGRAIYSRLLTDGFMFDIEALIVAKHIGLRGEEFPVQWANDSDTRYHPIWSTLKSFRELMGIRFRLLAFPPPALRLEEITRSGASHATPG